MDWKWFGILDGLSTILYNYHTSNDAFSPHGNDNNDDDNDHINNNNNNIKNNDIRNNDDDN